MHYNYMFRMKSW